MSAYCNYCETCTGVCGGPDQIGDQCVYEQRDGLDDANARLREENARLREALMRVARKDSGTEQGRIANHALNEGPTP